MNKYEVLAIYNNAATDEVKQALVEKLEAIITSNGGTVENTDKWGTKRFAYPINDQNEGYYVLTTFEAGAEVPALIERFFQVTDDAYRCMVTRK